MSDNGRRDSVTYKIEGSSVDDCINKLRERYGTDYYINSHREIPADGWWNRFTHKTKTEVTYMLVNLTKPRALQPLPENDLERQKQLIINSSGKMPNPQLADITKMLGNLNEKIDTIALKNTDASAVHPAIQKAEKFLAANDFTPAVIKRISQRLVRDLSLEEINNTETVQEKVTGWISELIQIDKPPVRMKKPRVIVLVGPTGEGKTTTVAKFAADNRKKYTGDNEQNIYMITIDQFRVAAGTQVEKYAESLFAKFAYAASADDIRKIAAQNSDIDLILIDSTGYSPKDYEHIGKMRKILDIPELEPEFYLTVSASKTTRAIMDIFKQYEVFDYRAVIVTKMDETDHIGNVVSVLAEKNKSVSYITTGQKVSSDIKEAEPLDFLQKLTDKKIWSE